ncbi:MAG TPA: hypothetical protein VG916_12830 [Gemmatimonadaceae bacterium]|nr:hypothetical protein [Gemmatimonadaceae bacterium]
MDAIQVALLTLAALFVGMLVPVMFQLWAALREVRTELHEVRGRIEPLIASAERTTQLTNAITTAAIAGVRAFRAAERERPPASPQPEGPQ